MSNPLPHELNLNNSVAEALPGVITDLGLFRDEAINSISLANLGEEAITDPNDFSLAKRVATPFSTRITELRIVSDPSTGEVTSLTHKDTLTPVDGHAVSADVVLTHAEYTFTTSGDTRHLNAKVKSPAVYDNGHKPIYDERANDTQDLEKIKEFLGELGAKLIEADIVRRTENMDFRAQQQALEALRGRNRQRSFGQRVLGLLGRR